MTQTTVQTNGAHQPHDRVPPPKPPMPTAADHDPGDPRRPAVTVDVDPNDVLPAPGQVPATLERITSSGQLQSVTDFGQITDAIVYQSPELPPGKYYAADGNGLALCMRVLGRKLRCRVLGHAPTKAELRRIRTATHFARKDKGAAQEQLEADLEEEMAETGATLTEAAVAIGISAGYASKIRSDSKLIPELHHLRENKDISRDSRRVIATMPTPELQKKLAERALAIVSAGKRASRDQLEIIATQLKVEAGLCRKPRQTKPMKFAIGGVVIVARGGVDAIKTAAIRLIEALKRLEKENLPPEILPNLLKS